MPFLDPEKRMYELVDEYDSEIHGKRKSETLNLYLGYLEMEASDIITDFEFGVSLPLFK
jgi:hypothetical protein